MTRKLKYFMIKVPLFLTQKDFGFSLLSCLQFLQMILMLLMRMFHLVSLPWMNCLGECIARRSTNIIGDIIHIAFATKLNTTNSLEITEVQGTLSRLKKECKEENQQNVRSCRSRCYRHEVKTSVSRGLHGS
jgi:hypothetical protein